MPATPDRNGWIDALRGLSALAVTLFHFNRVPVAVPDGVGLRAWEAVWQRGHWGVPVFFALSGYCLLPAWERASHPASFLWRRARRIFVPYWASLLLVGLLATGVKLATGVNDVASFPATLPAMLATLALATQPVTAIPTVNWVYWSLSSLIALYVLLSLPLAAPRRFRLWALAGLHVSLCLADVVWSPPAEGWLFFVKHWAVFGAGLALAVAFRSGPVGLVMVATSLAHALLLAILRPAAASTYVWLGLATAMGLALTRGRTLPAGLRPVAGVGVCAYSLLLVHVPLGIHGFLRFWPDHFSSATGYVFAQLAVLAPVLAAAWLFHRVVERPATPAPPPVPLIPATA